MNDLLEAEIEGIVDKQLQDCGFIDLCTRIAQKVVEKVQKIEEDHGMIKHELNEIEEKLTFLFSDKLPPEDRLSPVKKDVIVIEEEEEERTPLVSKLHEITKSSQGLPYDADIFLPLKQQATPLGEIGAKDGGVDDIVSQNQKMSSSRKRNASGYAVYSEKQNHDGGEPSAVPKTPSQQNRQSHVQKSVPEPEIVSNKDSSNAGSGTQTLSESKSRLADVSLESQLLMQRGDKENARERNAAMASEGDDQKLMSETGKDEKEKDAIKMDEKSSGNLMEQQAHVTEDKSEEDDDIVDEGYEFQEGDKVLGKPEKSDIWYTAKISKIIVSKYQQKKYQVKFESGFRMHGTLPGNSLAPIAHPRGSSLKVGSRVVAIRPRDTVDARIQKKFLNLYSSVFARGEILYGGVVVERSCEENKHRFLVFFDDGFAQYLTEKKMHLVINAAENVWQDVSIHCRDFIKEYLEEFPDRPMLKVKPGLTIQTEWNGKWLQAKVIAVDGSLVKMLFDIDKRTEWIYRGSTRLEPLYLELERRDLEALKNKSRKSSKKKKAASSNLKKVEPYVESAITKPCFGISRFSKTDPQGIQQIKEWGPMEEEKPVTQQKDEPVMLDSVSRSTAASPSKVASETQQPDASSRKRKLVDQRSSGYLSDVDADFGGNEVGSNRTTKDLSIGLTSPSPIGSTNVPSPKQFTSGRPIQRHSSHSSIESAASDSQLLLRNKKQSRLERKLSNHSIQSSQPDRTDWHSRDMSRHKLSSSDVNNGLGVPRSLTTHRNSMNKVATDFPSDEQSPTRPPSRFLLPRPSSQQLLQYFNSVPHVFIPRFEADTPHTQRQVGGNVISLDNWMQSFPKVRGPHKCSKSCVVDVHLPPEEINRHNPLSIPLILGWTRETAKRKPGYHRDIYYRAPCSRRLRNTVEVSRFLLQTKTTNVTIDQFSFDSSISCRDQIPVFRMPCLRIDDISYGKEKRPVQCVNEKNSEMPPMVDYVGERIIGHRININTDQGFLACCDCTDNCQDRSKCACVQLTIDSSDAIDGKKDERSGYHYRRLKDCVTTGIYECNRNCSCQSTCHNRVVQNGIGVRLQVFMTESKGWGLRCLDDIPRGTFICTYSGQILNEDMADREGKDFGDEYLAELDHIEIVEKAKEGYESDVPELRDENKPKRNVSFESSLKEFDSDSDESEFGYSTSSDSSLNVPVTKQTLKESTDDALKSPSEKEGRSKFPSDNFIDLTLESDPEIGDDHGDPNEVFSSNDAEGQSSSLDYMIQRLKRNSADEKSPKTGKTQHLKDFTGDSSIVADVRKDSQRIGSKEQSQSPLFYIDMDSDDRFTQQQKTAKDEEESENGNDLPIADPPTDSKCVKTKVEPEAGVKVEMRGKSPKAKSCEVTGTSKVPKLVDEVSECKSKTVADWNCEVKKAIEKVGPTIRTAIARKSTRSILFQRLASKKSRDSDEDGDGDGGRTNAKDEVKTILNSRAVDTFLSSEMMNPGKTFTSPRSSTGGHFARKAMSLKLTPPGQQQQQHHEQQQPQQNSSLDGGKSTRQLFGEDQCYVIDAKSFGNIGRYLNHSCMPNLFVQNVFISTHDLRFPFVAFFAQQNIPALSELTWDYSYEVGSVPGKLLQCHCGALECRGRLL